VSDSLDFEALETAGLANARERADLIKYLGELGFTVEEMAEAEQRGRLFGLSGDVLQWSGRPIHTLATAGEQLDLSAEDVARVWGLLGLTVAGPDIPVLSQADVVMLATKLELGATNAYAGQVAALHDPQLAHLFAQLSADEAVHWTTLNNAAGAAIPTKAFLFG